MADKFKRYTDSIQIFYKHLDDVIAHYGEGQHKILMFGSGTPANMAIYYLKIHGITVEAILDNNPSKQGTYEYNTPVHQPEEYLAEFDADIRIMVASSHEDAMIAQLNKLGYGEEQIVRLIHFREAAADYSFANRTGYRELDRMEVRERQMRVLNHLKEICDKHGLRYWLCGGTLLGAVRHQGYIPWDDDMDVFVEMKDLKKLAQILVKDSDYGLASFVFPDMDYCDSCSYMYEIASDMDVNYFPMQASLGVSIDIFPLVGIPGDEEEKQQYITNIKRLHEAVWNKMYSLEELQKAKTELLEYMSSFDFDECENCGYILSRHFTKEIWSADCFRGVAEMSFEGQAYRVPPKWEKYLEALYGDDYMVPPPETSRIPQHNYKAYVRQH